MSFCNYLDCCAVVELGDIRNHTAQETLKTFYPSFKDSGSSVVVFSDVTKQSPNGDSVLGDPSICYGKLLAEYITKQKLGKVISISPVPNSNSMNWVKVWVWRVDKIAYDKWNQTNRK